MSDEQRLRAWAYLSRVAEAPCAELAELITQVGPVDAAERVRAGAVGPQVGRRTEARRDIDCCRSAIAQGMRSRRRCVMRIRPGRESSCPSTLS